MLGPTRILNVPLLIFRLHTSLTWYHVSSAIWLKGWLSPQPSGLTCLIKMPCCYICHICLTGLFQRAKVQLAIIITWETGQATNLTISLGTSAAVLDPKADQNSYNGVPRITQISTSVNPQSLAIIPRGNVPQMSLVVIHLGQGRQPCIILLRDEELQREVAHSSYQSACNSNKWEACYCKDQTYHRLAALQEAHRRVQMLWT